ncbi:single-stranded-DNA-specific exonuclease RecJ [Microcoleus sp. FACHB-1515]|uniref:single-stranded-DNA-specific exonuclease RecJ n=1 Tax=Cyanophyceae TaxID=3028117 RepID=UPI0016893AB7|nr:single-stranded-DNA-specific exonuclease RecJ [Microcoleus sp. FACHB-1515]MBD2091113.1 single-stranded-DNA-specific exonuclease RecJ [Microcoleus sp. FACHB-1515]
MADSSSRSAKSAGRSKRRLPNQRWQIAPAQLDQAEWLAQTTGLSPLLAQVMINRGVNTAEAAQTFLQPESQLLPSPIDEFPDLTLALELLMRAIALHEPIAICGDYDADGMTSTALLLRALRAMGAIVDYAIPSRMQEGYGLNRRIVEDFHNEGVKIILTVDNGIAAHDPIDRARELGLVVIVTDHHDVPPTLPRANAILNPKLIAEDSPYRGVAGVGVAYILAVCLAQCLKQTQDLTAPLIELFTLGTIADLAPLTGVNRRWVRRGLKLLPQSKLAGVQALIQVAGLGSEKALKPEAIGFRLGPRINAVGRIADPQIVIELLTTDRPGDALELAMKCEEINQHRQRLCELIEQEAIAWCESSKIDVLRDRFIVVVQPNWHHGVIGIVASRLVERYGVPVFIGTYEDEAKTQVRGSVRSIPEFNVFEALQFCGDILEKFGGHRAAGGFTLAAEHLDELRARLQLFAHQQLLPQHLKPLITIDTQANLSDLSIALHQQIDALHPCGIDNPDPIFWTPNLQVVDQQTVGRNHLKVTLRQGNTSLKAIAWRWAEFMPLPDRVDVAYKLRLNEWNGQKSIELELVGLREADLPVGSQASEGEPPAVKLNSAAHSSPLPDSPAIEFSFSQRTYACTIATTAKGKELRIRNSDGFWLMIAPQQKQGRLGKTIESAQIVDLSLPHYDRLIRAALHAIEVAEQRDRIAQKNQQIVMLQQQIEELSQTCPQTIAPQIQALRSQFLRLIAAIEQEESHHRSFLGE